MPSESSRPKPGKSVRELLEHVEGLEEQAVEMSEECVYLRNELAHATQEAVRYEKRCKRLEAYSRDAISAGRRSQDARCARDGFREFLRVLKKETA